MKELSDNIDAIIANVEFEIEVDLQRTKQEIFKPRNNNIDTSQLMYNRFIETDNLSVARLNYNHKKTKLEGEGLILKLKYLRSLIDIHQDSTFNYQLFGLNVNSVSNGHSFIEDIRKAYQPIFHYFNIDEYGEDDEEDDLIIDSVSIDSDENYTYNNGAFSNVYLKNDNSI